MSMHEQVVEAIQSEMAAAGIAIPLSPTSLANVVQSRLCPGDIEPRIKYTSLEHIKQIARRVLARSYDVDGQAADEREDQGQLFEGDLQVRYPVRGAKSDEPIYKPRETLTRIGWESVIATLTKSGKSRLRHADAGARLHGTPLSARAGMTRPDSSIPHGTLAPVKPTGGPGHAVTWRCDLCRAQSGVVAGRRRKGPLWVCAGCADRDQPGASL